MGVLVGIALLSLFIPLKLKLPLLQLRPFDLLAIVLTLLVAARLRTLPTPRQLAGVALMTPFLAWHAISAFALGADNGLRETLQVGLLTAFGLSVCCLLPTLDYRRLGMLLLVGMLAVTAYNAGYHIAIRHPSGWKTLSDMKETFTFLPSLLGVYILVQRGGRREWQRALWLMLGVAILFSGERKALLSYFILSAGILARGRLTLAIPALAGGALAVVLAGALLEGSYAGRQIASLTDPTGRASNTYDMVVRGATPAQLSNAQRIFALHNARQMLAEHPVVGVGTNGYMELVRQRYQGLPEYLLNGIHSEFLRVLVENGAVGLALYLLIFVGAGWRLANALAWLYRLGAISAEQARLLPLVILTPALLSLSLEASGTHAFITLLFLSVTPDLLVWGLGAPRLAEAQGRAASVPGPVGGRSARA